jgi:2-keto-4-pentenoate hydratase/2-oxohepta-3-ene-1,7-dioic acid hydratase in catechol pathway
MTTRFATFVAGGKETYGIVTDQGVIDLGARFGARHPALIDAIRASALPELRATAAQLKPDFSIADIRFRNPVPGGEKILCVGVNYANRNAEYRDGEELPKYPSLFFRTPDSLVGHNEPIVRPKLSDQLDYEGEIVLVIGRHASEVARQAALGVVAGVTLCNEGSVRDWLRHAKFNVTQGKNFDRSGSVGPWIVPADEIDLTRPLRLTTRVNGEVRQDDTTENLIFDFPELIRYITSFMTLKPGDLIVTGTPTGAGARFDPPKWLRPGDVVEVSVPEIGTLRNEVIAAR